ncbi:MAG: Nramp family divalent metal transporter [Methanobacteriaceae archaeon]|nr:Nramp family divalent metal transporter [Methanobacteriaceae archaeon]
MNPLQKLKEKILNNPKIATLILFLSVMGPGLITATVDNDPGGILTYSLAGANFGYELLWTFIPMVLALIMAQEMGVRMGIISGKGLASLIREKVGVKVTLIIMIALLIANTGNTLAEFSGIVVSSSIFGLPKLIVVPLSAIFIWLLVIKGNYKIVEKVFICASLVYLTYIVAGLLAHPNWAQVAAGFTQPKIELNTAYISMVVGLVGTTIAPWMQFYLQSSVVEKGTSKDELKYSRIESIIGPAFTCFVGLFILLSCAATIHTTGTQIVDVQDVSTALLPVAGEYASLLFAIGFLNASLFSAVILPLSTAYYICESLGLETGISKSFKEAPVFHGLYAGMILLAAIIILLPGIPLMDILFFSQVANGVLLPVILVLMLLIVNDKKIMGEYVNSKKYNILATLAVIIITLLVVIMLVTSFI